ncbi:DegT/DnrJ/EryC1/StrS aminotransferase family protein [Arhodomonas aquaeolei]|uniref:DegT/DnrJ/EryC1/StrS family aminotransferase n=1 Tax=Arhodomonas aquaeolei TaxID=2369 RepID=UPI002166EF50|nr:DegT/DnrJ/EryC1/StrS aminotransferase family protein [Arhodomonas aquaeolei]MCS4504461.1 DegT/DnrJ/EryC1/StrS aminotransferase family protein [Arhodomonas aquaeolei]
MKTFSKSFTQQEPISEEAIEQAVSVLRSGRLHRYNTAPGEPGEAALLEREFADYIGLPYCLACASGGYALHVALCSLGLDPGEPVLSNAFTLSPVPGAIHNAGARAVLVETNEDYTVDLQDLRRAAEESGARVFLLSHMRGHIADMDAIAAFCDERGITLVEDCAHTMGARWRGRMSGTFGTVACFSTQTYKHLNSGEGGLLVTGDAEVMRRAVLLSGSYMFYDRHLAAPPPETFSEVRLDTPNYSGRMDNLRAAVLRPQLRELDERCRRWNHLYAALERGLREIPGVRLPTRPAHEAYVGSSIQFSLPELDAEAIRSFCDAAAQRGVPVKWFGDPEPKGYTSRYDSWRYLAGTRSLPRTATILATLCDIRIPLTFTEADCESIAEILAEALDVAVRG